MMASRQALAGVAVARPRLMATTAPIDRMGKIVQTDPMAADWSRKIIAQVDHLLRLPPLTQTWVNDLVETGNAGFLDLPPQRRRRLPSAISPLAGLLFSSSPAVIV